ncbi:MAG: InlB B-repeat-containing protein [Kosmotoga sp.]|nr:MAG: InlB B-repeat-containing protein [Kosmotoga sp.]
MKKTILYVLIVVILFMFSGCPVIFNPIEIPDQIANEGEQFKLDLTDYTNAVNINEVKYKIVGDSVGRISGQEFIWDNPTFDKNGTKVTIKAENDRGVEKESDFKITVNRKPTQPENISPNNYDYVVGNPIVLKWESTDEDVENDFDDYLKFDVYFGNDQDNLDNIAEDIEATSTKVEEELVDGANYYWQVVAKDRNSEVESDIWEFEYGTSSLIQVNAIVDREGDNYGEKIKVQINGETKAETENATSIYTKPSTVTLTAIFNANKSSFSNWDVNSDYESQINDTSDTEIEIYVNERDLYATATFQLNRYNITVGASPAEGGEVTGGRTYKYGDKVIVTATPNEGYNFIGWIEDEDIVSTNATYTFTVDSDRNLTAEFEEKTYTLNVAKEGNGITYPEEGSYTKKATWTETLIATPTGDYEFRGWKLSTGETIEATTTEIDVNDETITATALFKRPEFEITVSATPTEGGTVTGGGTYELNSNVTVIATPNEHWGFNGWFEDSSIVSTNTSYTFNATEDRDLVAQFKSTLLTIDSTPLSGIPILVNGEEKPTPYSTSLNPGQSIEVTASPTLMLNLINEEDIPYSDFGAQNDASFTFVKWSDDNSSGTRTFDENNNGKYIIEYDVEFLLKTNTWPSLTYIDRDSADVNFPKCGWYKYGTSIALRVPKDTYIDNEEKTPVAFNNWEINGIKETDNRTTKLDVVFNEPKFIVAVYNPCAAE